jgi:dihydroceramidase
VELPEGFWGAPSSSVDWCETNYEHTRYVCELFNTLSSVAMLVAAGLGLWLHRRALEARFTLAFLAVALVGIGSVAFHATLRFDLQMLDEVPMLWSALAMLYILIEDRPARRFGSWLPVALIAHGLLVTALTAFTRGGLQVYLFHASFDSMEAFALYRVYRIHRRATSARLRAVYRVGMGAYALAIVAWVIDFRGCEAVRRLPVHGLPNPQLHAWWHVLVSVGLYMLTVVEAFDRLEVLGRAPTLALAWGVWPFACTPATPAAGE